MLDFFIIGLSAFTFFTFFILQIIFLPTVAFSIRSLWLMRLAMVMGATLAGSIGMMVLQGVITLYTSVLTFLVSETLYWGGVFLFIRLKFAKRE